MRNEGGINTGVQEASDLVTHLRMRLEWAAVADTTGMSVTALQDIKRKKRKRIYDSTIAALRDAVVRLDAGLIGGPDVQQPEESMVQWHGACLFLGCNRHF